MLVTLIFIFLFQSGSTGICAVCSRWENPAPTLASVATCTVENGAVLEKPQSWRAGTQCCIANANHFQPCV